SPLLSRTSLYRLTSYNVSVLRSLLLLLRTVARRAKIYLFLYNSLYHEFNKFGVISRFRVLLSDNDWIYQYISDIREVCNHSFYCILLLDFYYKVDKIFLE